MRLPWISRFLYLVLATIMVSALLMTGRGTKTALADDKEPPVPAEIPFTPGDAISGPTFGEAVYPYVFEGDVRDLPQTNDNLTPKELPRYDLPTPAADSNPAPSSPDPVLQDWDSSIVMPSPNLTFAGLDLANWGAGWPPDTNGVVGPEHYIQTVNTSIGIYSKAGAQLATFTFNTFFAGAGSPCSGNNRGDPIALYDHLADRWIITDFAWLDIDNGPYYECIAISRTGDPIAGGWYQYVFQAHPTYLNDYPKLGVWTDGYYMSANMFDISGGGASSSYQGTRVWALDRASMLTGGALNNVYFDVSSSYFTLLPSNLQGQSPPAGSPNYFLAASGSTSLYLWKFDVDWATPANSTFTGPTAITTSAQTVLCPGNRECIPQLGTTRQLDAISPRLMQKLQYRSVGGTESLWVTHTINNGSGIAGVRWYEIRNPNGTPALYQQGTYTPDSNHRWMGSIGTDRLGNMAVGYSVSSSAMFPAIRYAGRLVSDALGTLGQGEATLFAGAGSQTTYNRWGDYSEMSIDPEDDCTFWYTNEYYAATGTNWQTRIGSFKYPQCDSTKYWIGGASSDWSNPANWSPAGAPTRYDDVVIDTAHKTAYWPVVNANSEAHNLTIGDGAQLTAAADFPLNVYGDWSQSGSGAFNASAGTVTFLGTTPSLAAGAPGGGNHFYNLQIGDGTRTPSVALNSNLRAEGNFSVQSRATFSAGANTIEVGGSFDVQGTFTPGTSTLRFIGSGSRVLNIAGQQSRVTVLSEDFTSWPLVGWSIVNNGGNCVWRAGSNGDADPNYTGGSGEYADADSDACGSGTTMDTGLQTPGLNLTGYSNPWVEFKSDMRWFSTDQWDVDLSLDGGSTWPTNLLHRSGSNYRGPATINLDMVGAGGQANVKLRFRYRGAYDYWWQVDEVRVYAYQTSTGALHNLEVSSAITVTLGRDLAINNHLTISSGGVLDLSTYAATVDGALTNNGKLSQTKVVPASLTEFLHITNAAATADKYHGVDITPAGAMGSTTVAIQGNQSSCTTNPADPLLTRCFTITPTTAQSAAIKFWFTEAERNGQSANALKVWHFSTPPPTWIQVGSGYTYSESGTVCTSGFGQACWIQALNISTYSPFEIGGGNAPTAILLHSLAAVPERSAWVLVISLGLVLCGIILILTRRRRKPAIS
jgi:hypothetical protein